MSRKIDGTERSGRGTAPPAAGAFGGSDTALSRLARPFVPKPFRSTGGMSTSADTMMSLAMGRHNTDEEIPEDQVNISSIVDRKVSDRRYLPRKLGNMKKYLHTTPISESLSESSDSIGARFLNYERTLDEALEGLSQKSVTDFLGLGTNPEDGEQKRLTDFLPDVPDALKSAAGVVLPLVPYLGDLYFGYRAYNDFKDIKKESKRIEKILADNGLEIDLFSNPDENIDKIAGLVLKSAADRAAMQDATLKIPMLSYYVVTGIMSAIPFELFPGLAAADAAIDSALNIAGAGIALADPTGEGFTESFYELCIEYKNELERNQAEILKYIPERAKQEVLLILNFMSNIALIHATVANFNKNLEAADDPDVFAEGRRRRKQSKKNEMSTAGSVAGFTGPLKSPVSPKQFYSTMARAAGSEYLVDPVKTLKPKP